MECEDIINKKFNRSFIGYDIGQVDAFLDELYSEMQALKAELEMLRAARQMNSDSKPKHGSERIRKRRTNSKSMHAVEPTAKRRKQNRVSIKTGVRTRFFLLLFQCTQLHRKI